LISSSNTSSNESGLEVEMRFKIMGGLLKYEWVAHIIPPKTPLELELNDFLVTSQTPRTTQDYNTGVPNKIKR
jgi:hypothetical protein